MYAKPLEVKVWGDYACFTSEMKVERVSYPVMTPSAARGVLESIFWRKEFEWRVQEIRVLKPIRYASILRNEVGKKLNPIEVSAWPDSGGRYYADDHRQQRHTLALRDVAYLISAQVCLKPHADADEAKYRDQFRRRVSRGQCFQMPYLGCREFVGFFAEPSGDETPIDYTATLGLVLFDIDYEKDGNGRGSPKFFTARLDGGVLSVPAALYERGVS